MVANDKEVVYMTKKGKRGFVAAAVSMLIAIGLCCMELPAVKADERTANRAKPNSVDRTSAMVYDSWTYIADDMVLQDGDVLDISMLKEDGLHKPKIFSIRSQANVTIIGNADSVLEGVSIYCGDDVTLTVENIKMVTAPEKAGPKDKASIHFTGGMNNRLLFSGKNQITFYGESENTKIGAGIAVPAGVGLELNGVDRLSTLEVNGGPGAAGIGGGYGEDSGDITIRQATVTVRGQGAGIGGGQGMGMGASSGQIVIDDAIVTAIGQGGAGIGGGAGSMMGSGPEGRGYGGHATTISISDSQVKASGYMGAGIGGGLGYAMGARKCYGYGGHPGVIKIDSSIVQVTGKGGAGIGSGEGRAEGQEYSNGIGGGSDMTDYTGMVTITGDSEITANGDGGAGIGGGQGSGYNAVEALGSGGALTDIVIEGGKINVAGGAGIGGGDGIAEGSKNTTARGGDGGHIIVTDASLKARGGMGSAAIGGGYAKTSGQGSAKATGGNGGYIMLANTKTDAAVSSSQGVTGAVIGGGAANTQESQGRDNTAYGGYGGNIQIVDGGIKAYISANESLSAAIGGGGAYGGGSTTSEGGGAKITVTGIAAVETTETPLSIGGGMAHNNVQNERETEILFALLKENQLGFRGEMPAYDKMTSELSMVNKEINFTLLQGPLDGKLWIVDGEGQLIPVTEGSVDKLYLSAVGLQGPVEFYTDGYESVKANYLDSSYKNIKINFVTPLADVEPGSIPGSEAKAPMFSDIQGHWAEAAIVSLAQQGVIAGMTAESFAPDDSVTRAQFAAIIVRALDLDAGRGGYFRDVMPDSWYYKDASAVYVNGIMSGYPSERFMPDDLITREQTAVIVGNAMNYIGKTYTVGDGMEKLNAYDDVDDISAYAKKAMALAVQYEMMNFTDNALRPKATLTRAEAAWAVYRVLYAR